MLPEEAQFTLLFCCPDFSLTDSEHEERQLNIWSLHLREGHDRATRLRQQLLWLERMLLQRQPSSGRAHFFKYAENFLNRVLHERRSVVDDREMAVCRRVARTLHKLVLSNL